MPKLNPPAGMSSAQVLQNPNVVLVFWGDSQASSQGLFWVQNPDYQNAGVRFFIEFLRGYNMDRLGQYGVNIANICSVCSFNSNYDPNGLGSMLVSAISDLQVANPTMYPDMLYVYIIDPTSSHAYFDGDKHATFEWNGTTAPYTFAPFNFELFSFTPAADGWTWWRQNAGVYTTYVSHEVYESFTDPIEGYGWTDTTTSQGHVSECSDICEDTLCGGDFCPFNFGPWSTESYWSNQDGECILGFAPNWTSLGSPPSGISGSVAVVQNANAGGAFDGTGTWNLFAVTPQGDLWCYSGNTANTNGTWTGGVWNAQITGAKLSGPPIAAHDASQGLVEVFAISTANSPGGTVWHTYQTAPNGPWFAGESLGAPPNCSILGNVSIARNAPNANGYQALEAFVFASDGNVYHMVQLGPWKGWSGWASLGAPPGGIAAPTSAANFAQLDAGPVVARNENGQLEVFVIDTNQQIWHIWQNAPNSAWSDWYSLGLIEIAPPLQKAKAFPQTTRGSLTCGIEPDGSIELFVAATDGNIYHNLEAAAGPERGWSTLQPLGLAPAFTFGAYPSATDGSTTIAQCQVFALGNDGALWTAYQANGPGQWQPGVFQPWRFLGAPPSATTGVPPFTVLLQPNQPPVTAVGSGGLTVFVVGPDGDVWSLSQTAAYGVWGPLASPGV